jgi:NADH-quinone oxidoreductase subunit J
LNLYVFYITAAVAVLEVLIYAGAIMVLFLFIVMMLEMGTPKRTEPFWRTWGPGALMSLVLLYSTSILFIASPESGGMPNAPFISPRQFGVALYTKYMLGVEAVSLLLLFALVGALYLGRRD